MTNNIFPFKKATQEATIVKDGAKVATYSNEMIAHISEILKEEKDKQP